MDIRGRRFGIHLKLQIRTTLRPHNMLHKGELYSPYVLVLDSGQVIAHQRRGEFIDICLIGNRWAYFNSKRNAVG
jgi:hypothetical protein